MKDTLKKFQVMKSLEKILDGYTGKQLNVEEILQHEQIILRPTLKEIIEWLLMHHYYFESDEIIELFSLIDSHNCVLIVTCQ